MSLELYGAPAVAFAHLAAEVGTEVRLLRAVQAELAEHAAERETCYRWVDPLELARSLPGLAEIGGPALAACIGDPTRVRQRQGLPLLHRPGPQGIRDRRHRPQGPADVQGRVRAAAHHAIRAADNARRQDPQLARIYYIQMVERGKDHLGAICVVAAHLAERFWTVMNRQMPYVICDTNGQAVDVTEAKTIIAEH